MQISLIVYSGKTKINSLVNKWSPLLSTGAKRNVFKGTLNFYSKRERLLCIIHRLKFLDPKPDFFGSPLMKVNMRGNHSPPSTSLGRGVDRAHTIPIEGQGIVGINLFSSLLAATDHYSKIVSFHLFHNFKKHEDKYVSHWRGNWNFKRLNQLTRGYS